MPHVPLGASEKFRGKSPRSHAIAAARMNCRGERGARVQTSRVASNERVSAMIAERVAVYLLESEESEESNTRSSHAET